VSEDDRFIDLEVKLAFQERLIRELDALVRELADRVGKAEQRLAAIPAAPVVTERPPHY
jgi:uncharacterized coiled-coil protein SlyX